MVIDDPQEEGFEDTLVVKAIAERNKKYNAILFAYALGLLIIFNYFYQVFFQ